MTALQSSRLASWYQGKRVFLTGHTGFKGAWLALWLLEMGPRSRAIPSNHRPSPLSVR